jgi:hypothetical protein
VLPFTPNKSAFDTVYLTQLVQHVPSRSAAQKASSGHGHPQPLEYPRHIDPFPTGVFFDAQDAVRIMRHQLSDVDEASTEGFRVTVSVIDICSFCPNLVRGYDASTSFSFSRLSSSTRGFPSTPSAELPPPVLPAQRSSCRSYPVATTPPPAHQNARRRSGRSR